LIELLLGQHPFDQAGILELMLAAQRLQRLEGQHPLAVLGLGIAQALLLDDDDLAQSRELVQRGQHLVGLLLILADHDLDVGMRQHVGHLGRGAGRVHAHRDPAHQARAHLREHPFDAVLGDHAHVASLGQPQRAQAVAHVGGPLEVVAPGDRAPDAEVLLADRDRVGARARALAQHLRQRQLGEAVRRARPCGGSKSAHCSRLTTASACGACSA